MGGGCGRVILRPEDGKGDASRREMFRRILAALLDEDEEAPYCTRKYNIYGGGNEED